MSEVTTGYAPVNGLKMYYEVHGDGAGRRPDPRAQLAVLPGATHMDVLRRADLMVPLVSGFLKLVR